MKTLVACNMTAVGKNYNQRPTLSVNHNAYKQGAGPMQKLSSMWQLAIATKLEIASIFDTFSNRRGLCGEHAIVYIILGRKCSVQRGHFEAISYRKQQGSTKGIQKDTS